jgi:hypothetical protein
MPEEIFILAALAIIVGAFIKFATMIIEYLKSRQQPVEGQGGLTASELRGMLVDAVREANEPLESRISMLEDILIGTPHRERLEGERKESRLLE